jgi:polyhydroxyalkanoate synthase
VVAVNSNQMSAAIDAQRRTWELMAEAVEKADISAEQFVELMTVDVGHTESEVVHAENKLTLHYYEPEEKRHETPIFIVYALVNRPYILDLQPDRSVIRHLLSEGFAVYLIDWGEPSVLDQSLTMADYIHRYTDNCMQAVREHADVEDVHLLGYCMGGTMSIMYATQYPDTVRTLSLMATPLSFDGEGGILERWATHFDPDTTVDALGNLPAELLAAEFSMMDPIDQYITKYVNLYENIEDTDFVRNFARMEQWIWDGVDVAGEVYREFINDIYKGNQLVNGEYSLDGDRIDLADIEMPAQQIVGKYDHIVPSASSKPFNEKISSEDERIVEFGAGHIGISVSSKAHESLWPDVCEWFAERDVSREHGATDAGPASGTPASDGAAGETAAAGTMAIESIRGIGPTYAERLGEAGIETAADLREHDPQELADIAQTGTTRTEDWLEQVA